MRKWLFALPLCFAPLAHAQLTPAANAATPTDPSAVQQLQAAQLVSDLITFTVDQGDARLKEMQTFLRKNGKANDSSTPRSIPPQSKGLTYTDVFKAALQIEQQGKDANAQKSVASDSNAAVMDLLKKAQFYNMHEFQHFNQQRDQFAAMQDYLKSIGLLDQFQKESGGSSAPTSAPAEQDSAAANAPQAAGSTDEIEERMVGLMQSMKESAWENAKPSGMSRSDFDSKWPQMLADYRNFVQSRVDAIGSQAASLGRAQAAGSTPPPNDQSVNPPQTQAPGGGSTAAVAPTPPTATAPPSPPLVQAPVQSLYTNETFRARNDELWNMWDYRLTGGGRRHR